MQVPHFAEEGRTDRPDCDRLPEQIYSQALDHLVIACVDLVFTQRSQLLLAQRRNYPRRSWWIIGGRMRAGENPLLTAQRKAQQEAGLPLSLERFHYLGIYSTCFAQRQQPPQTNGLHSLNIVYQVELTPQERTSIQLIASEYETWQWIAQQDLSRLFSDPNIIDQALLHILNGSIPIFQPVSNHTV